MNATDLLANILYRRRGTMPQFFASRGHSKAQIHLTHPKDANTRQDATQKLEVASRDNYREYMLMMSTVLVEEGNPMHVRNAAGLALKNALTARVRVFSLPSIQPVASHDAYLGFCKASRVLHSMAHPRCRDKEQDQGRLTDQSPSLSRHLSAQVVSAIAAV
ncbi:hypothetical protein HGRIS_001029 [Hohenbuehelia grisea]|uniref:Importin N-terminal domain-containing protein n=1 Tax=Hohenbuehelia grisea TaxID=104357 RepID=A0ABR3JN21_9AGAR